MDPETEAPASFEFGRFKILPQHRDVLADGRPLRLGGRAFDVLVVLVEANGAVVGKDELIRRVWPRRIVAENNLHAQIRALRRAFSGQDVIRTVVGRGYQFRGELRIPGASREAPTRPASGSDTPHLMPARTNLPVRTSDLIGRGGEIAAIIRLVTDHRLVTLTGLGGIGKTRLAIEVARQLEPRFADGVWIAELAPLTDAGLVPPTVAAALGLELASGVISPARVAEALGPKHLLLVLDNC